MLADSMTEARPESHRRPVLRGLRWLAALLVIALLGTLGCSSFTNRMLLHPSNHFMPTSAERVEFVGGEGAVEGLTLEAFYRELGPGESEPELYVLALTGNAGRAESMQQSSAVLMQSWLGGAQAPRRVGVLSLQYPGYGVNPSGEASLESLTAAVVEAVRYLRERAHSRPVFVHALSMGTVAALHATRLEQGAGVQGLVLVKPPNLASMLVGEYGWWNLWLIAYPMALQLPDSALSSDNAAEIRGVPALFLIAEADQVVPLRYAVEVLEAYAGPKRRVAAPGGHNTTVRSSTCSELDAGLRWLWQQGGSVRSPASAATVGD